VLQELEMIEQFKYLDVEFDSKWSWRHTKDRLAQKARARLAVVSKAILEGLSLDTGENLWNMTTLLQSGIRL